jgi:hypothetical protein
LFFYYVTLATPLAEVPNLTAVRVAAPTRTAKLRVVGIDISVDKEELRQALASTAGCGSAEVTSWRNRRLQRRPWVCMDKMPDGRNPETSPGRKSEAELVHGKGYCDPKEALAML